MFFKFDYSIRNIFNSDKDKFLVVSYIIFNTNYADMFNGLNNGECYVSYKILGDSTGVSFSKLKRILKELEADDFIEWVYKSKSRHNPSILSLKNVKVKDQVESQVNVNVKSKVKPLIVNVLNDDNVKVNVKVKSKVNVKVNDKLYINNINNNIENSIKDMSECLLMDDDNCSSEHQKDSIINDLQTASGHQNGTEYGLNHDSQEFNQGSNTVKAKKVKVSQEQIESIWALYPNKKGKATAIKKIPKLIEQYTYDQLKRAVERYTAEIKQKNVDIQYVKHGDTFFNSGYMDYLDSNYSQEQQLEGHNKFGMYEHDRDYDEIERLALERKSRLAEERQQRNT